MAGSVENDTHINTIQALKEKKNYTKKVTLNIAKWHIHKYNPSIKQNCMLVTNIEYSNSEQIPRLFQISISITQPLNFLILNL